LWSGSISEDAPTVVLLHGRGSNEREMAGLASQLPAHFTVASVRGTVALGPTQFTWFENRGIGHPVAESPRSSIDSFRAWLHDVAGDRPVALVGICGGTALAGGCVIDDPSRFAGAALLYGTIPFDVDEAVRPAVRLREFIGLAQIADEAGLDVFSVGEHHRPDFAISSPAVVLAAIAEAISRIRLTSTVTVLSTSDPVRVYEDFATLDLISRGRAEITAGRGAYVESFPLYGFELEDYDDLFDEKLDLLLRINRHERVTWSGHFRAPLREAGVYPRVLEGEIPVWIAVGGTPASIVRAGRHGLPAYFAILGQPEGFVDLATLYRQSGRKAGFADEDLRLGVTSYFFVGETSQGARDVFYPYYWRYIGKNMPQARGNPPSRDAFDAWASPHGGLFCGSPQEIIDKMLWEYEMLGHTRFLAQIALGGLPLKETARSIELLASEGLPVVRRATQTSQASVTKPYVMHRPSALMSTKLATTMPMATLVPVPRCRPEGVGMYQSGKSPVTASDPGRQGVALASMTGCGSALSAREVSSSSEKSSLAPARSSTAPPRSGPQFNLTADSATATSPIR
jgi:alkanesulfonate monooxygenase SsuD/methylene tetrahydromethanopterin reductase-like flavin-dependent oxidoreductase (luciferase family)